MSFAFRLPIVYTFNPLYNDTRYNDKIRLKDNLTGTNSSPRNYARPLHLILQEMCF